MIVASTPSTLVQRVAALFALLFGVMGAGAQQTAAAAPVVGHYYALVIGIDDYDTSAGLPP